MATTTEQQFDLVDALIGLDEDETLVLFQHLVDTGMAWQLQGWIGRQAADLIEAGLITLTGEAAAS